jgi:sec-independent protein translocase protein TatA
MGSLSIWHWIIVVVVVLLMFGRGKISELMGDMAQGIKAFKKGMQDDDKPEAASKDEPVRTIDNQPPVTNAASSGLQARADTEKRVEGSTL